MSTTPPASAANTAAPGASADPVTAGGEGLTLNPQQARGAQRTGAIWILAISLALAVAALGVYWLVQSPRMQAVNHPSGRDLNVKDVRRLYPATNNSVTAN